MNKIYPPKIFSFKKLFSRYFKWTLKIYGILLVVVAIISLLQSILGKPNNLFLSFSILKTLEKILPYYLDILVNIIAIAIILVPIILILFIIIILIYFLNIIFRKAYSYNTVYEGNNLVHIPKIIIPKVKLAKHEGLILFFSNREKKFKEASFTVNKIKAFDENNVESDWNIGIYLIDDQNRDIFYFHPYSRLNESNYINLAYYNNKIDKSGEGRYVVDKEIKINEFESYKLELVNKKIGCFINNKLRNYSDFEEPIIEPIHDIRFQLWIWSARNNNIEFIEANIIDLKIIWE